MLIFGAQQFKSFAVYMPQVYLFSLIIRDLSLSSPRSTVRIRVTMYRIYRALSCSACCVDQARNSRQHRNNVLPLALASGVVYTFLDLTSSVSLSQARRQTLDWGDSRGGSPYLLMGGGGGGGNRLSYNGDLLGNRLPYNGKSLI